MTPAPRAFLLSDGTDDALAEAAEMLQLDVVAVHPAALLPAAIDAHPSARAIVVATDDPVILRAIVERAGARRIPVILAGTNDVAYRRAIEFRVDDWYLAPARRSRLRGAFGRRSRAWPRWGAERRMAPRCTSTRNCSTTPSPECRRCR